MALGILGRKLGMTRVFGPGGKAIPLTVIEAGPCPVIQIRNEDTDGYNALQLGFGEVKEKKLTRPERNHLAKAGKGFFRHLREFRVDTVADYEVGSEITCEIFAPGDQVFVSGKSIGKGFQGVMKRWNFGGMPASHGHEKVHRSGGSVGNATFPGRVTKGKKMAGQMGNKNVTATNLVVFDVRPEDNVILIRGAVPGPKNGLVTVRKKS